MHSDASASAKGFLNTEAALAVPVSKAWDALPGMHHPGCAGTIRQNPRNGNVRGCDGCGRSETNWQPEFRRKCE